MSLLVLFLIFTKIAVLTFGGGYAMVPLFEHEIVTRHAFMSAADFANLIGLAQVTPGPIGFNAATYVGMAQGGLVGAVVASLGVMVPSIVISLVVALFLRKAADANLPEVDYAGLDDDEAQHLLRLISRFPDVIKDAADKYEPSMITHAVTDIAQAYNKFYYEHRVLDAEPAVSAARVALTKAVKDVIKTGLWLIGIEAPERM